MGLRFRFSPPGFQGAGRLTGFPSWAAKEPEECLSFSMLKEWEVVEFSVGALLNHISSRYCAMGNNWEPHLANCIRPRATWGVPRGQPGPGQPHMVPSTPLLSWGWLGTGKSTRGAAGPNHQAVPSGRREQPCLLFGISQGELGGVRRGKEGKRRVLAVTLATYVLGNWLATFTTPPQLYLILFI